MNYNNRIIWEVIRPYLQENGWEVWERLGDEETLTALLEYPSGHFFLKIDPAGRIMLRLVPPSRDILNRTAEYEGHRYAFHVECIMHYEVFTQVEDFLHFPKILENMTSLVLDFFRESEDPTSK